jgi:hypothetical protein
MAKGICVRVVVMHTVYQLVDTQNNDSTDKQKEYIYGIWYMVIWLYVCLFYSC